MKTPNYARIFSLFLFIILTKHSFASIIYVNINATGANNGTSWADAYTDLQTALSIAFVNDEIWVATGTYKPTTTTTRSTSFNMKNGVNLFGGFNGTESSIADRDIASNPTYLSGDIGIIGDKLDNTTKIVRIQNFTSPFTLDGFKIISGYDQSSSGKGAGIYIFNNPGVMITIKNTTFYDNYSYHSGGAALIDESNTTFENCEFLYNKSFNYGGGAIYSANVSKSKIYLNDCKFIGNNSREGAVINFDGYELVFERCHISSNTTTTSGNIILVSNGPTRFEINNSLIVGNQVADGGSSIVSCYTDDANSSKITNTTICHNKNASTSTPYAEAIHQSNTAMVITNCIIFGNTPSDMNAQIDPGNIVRNSIIENGYSTGTIINTSNPMFVNPGTLSLAPFNGTNYDYSLLEDSPAVNFGNNSYAQNFTLDLLKNNRIQENLVDCGAIESPFTDTQNPIARCKDTILPLSSTGEALLTANFINDNSSDNIGIVDFHLSVTNFDCSSLGQHIITLTVSDAAGNANTCNATVTVVDNLGPNVVTQNKTIYLDPTGNAVITVQEIDNGTTDNCQLESIQLSQTTFNCSHVGPNQLTFTAQDIHGNINSSQVIVTVIDSIFPIALVQNQTIYLNANGNAVVTAEQVDAGSTDDCSIANMQLSKTNFNCSNIGDNIINFKVTDTYGNQVSVPVTITVVDTTTPTTIGRNITLNLQESNPINITANQINNGSFDNCSFTQTIQPNSFTEVGTYNVVLTTTDITGNSSSETYTVEIIDQPIVATENEKQISFQIVPNPTEGPVTIKFDQQEDMINITVLDLSGKIISEKDYQNKSEINFNLTEVPGVYFLFIKTPSKLIQSHKLIKL